MHFNKTQLHLRRPVQRFSAPREDLRQKGLQSLGFRILSAHQGATIFLVRFACLSFAVTVGSTYRFFHIGHCDLAIDPYSPRRSENVGLRYNYPLVCKVQCTAASLPAIFGESIPPLLQRPDVVGAPKSHR